MAGRLSDEGRLRRDQVEEALACLQSVLRDVDECILRNQQAMRRTSVVVDVLDPAVRRLGSVREQVRQARQTLGDFWASEQERRWHVKGDGSSDGS